MKEKTEKRIETFVYGILSLLFTTAFFFGVLYPSHGISPDAYKVVDKPECRIDPKIKSKFEIADVLQGGYDVQLRDEFQKYDQKKIQYKFYFYERLKNS